MLSLRSLARSAPRSLPRLAAQSSRRQLYNLHQPTLLRASWRPTSVAKSAVAAFHTCGVRRNVNEELVAKLESEIRMEKDMRDLESYSGNIKDYLDNSPFEIHDTPGQEEVVLTRKFGDENIKVTFSIADLANMNPEDPDAEDQAMFDEEDSVETAQSGGANTKGAVNQGRTTNGNIKVAPEDNIAPADRPELDDETMDEEQEEASFPARVHVQVMREGQKGAIAIEAMAQDGDMVIDNVYYFPEAELAEAKTAELDWKRRGLYTGPPFGNLDEDLQILLERYLDERGINTSMALFVPDYIDFKEQKEYLRWLSNIKSFME